LLFVCIICITRGGNLLLALIAGELWWLLDIVGLGIVGVCSSRLGGIVIIVEEVKKL